MSATNLIKRNDIQWLRALAILAVLAFHIWPSIFPQGYLGVDIFFVISGYLMTLILEKSTNQSFFRFYLRRIKRIFPTCLFMITFFTALGIFYLLPSHFEYLKIEALWSVIFLNNFSTMFSEGQYFKLVSEFKFFLHTWSLGVEIQFYLIAPFLINFILSKNKPLFWIEFFTLISALSQLLVPYESVSFGLMFCRIWQFLIGTYAYVLSNEQSCEYTESGQEESEILLPQALENKTLPESIDEKVPKSSALSTKFTLFFLILICFIPFSFSTMPFIPEILRIISTILTGLFIFRNSTQPISLPYFCNRLLVYIGDASYSIYLFHWPIIIYFKYLNIFEIYGSFFTLFCLLIVSILVHELFEKPIGRASWTYNGIFFACCYAILFYLLVFNHKHWQTYMQSYILANEEEEKSCKTFYYPGCKIDPLMEKYFTNRPYNHWLDKHCSFLLNPKGNKTAIITGNSFVHFQIRGILGAIKQSKTQFLKVYVIAHPGCSLIVGPLNKGITRWGCTKLDGSHDELLKVLKPDFHIHTSRIDHIKELRNFPNTSMAQDPAYKAIKKTINSLASFSHRLIIIEPTPMIPAKSEYLDPLTVAQKLLTNASISHYTMSIKEYHDTMDPSWNRVKEAIKTCKNCVILPTEKLFCDDKICPLVDFKTKLGRYCGKAHITPRESLRFISGLIKAIDAP